MNKKQMGFVLSLTAVAALTLAGGVLQGRIRYRWGPPEKLLAAAKRLEDVPRQFGGSHSAKAPDGDRWQLQSSETMDQDTIKMLECTGYIVRTYTNQQTGDVVSMFVIVGPAGPIAVHTPEICYSSKNYTSRDPRQRVAIHDAQGQDDQFWALTFKLKGVREDLLRVYYAWSTGNRWSADADPRFASVGSPYLYKIQLSGTLPAGADLTTGDPCRDFLKDFVPVVRQYLVEPSQR